MSSWGVPLVIGKLITDEAFLQRFEARVREALVELCDQGIDLTDGEVAAFLETDPAVWAGLATQIDPRLRTGRSPGVCATHKRPRSLTAREQHVLRGIFCGRSNKQIAAEIGVSESVVKATVQQLFQKTKVRTRSQLVRVVVERWLAAPVAER
jgi:DNA-binding NarL/FixJ family response regulator